MYFCKVCKNMYYLKINIENPNTLVYYCRNCGNEDSNLSNESICVSETIFKGKKQKYTHIINEYTKYDNTLPRINTIKCPNLECSTNINDVKKEVIYVRYDDTNIKYVYLCAICDFVWKTNKNNL